MHRTLKNWRARRAGGRITVYGECQATHTPMKITNVDQIEPGLAQSNMVVAVDKDGHRHNLLLT